MTCQRCDSKQVIRVNGKCSDLCFVDYPGGQEHQGYVPADIGVGGGDYIRFSYCLDCGQMQGTFPLSPETPEPEEE